MSASKQEPEMNPIKLAVAIPCVLAVAWTARPAVTAEHALTVAKRLCARYERGEHHPESRHWIVTDSDCKSANDCWQIDGWYQSPPGTYLLGVSDYEVLVPKNGERPKGCIPYLR
jgi:hypothetical protein